MQHVLREGQARLVQGDALKLDDVARGWTQAQAASASGDVDVALFSAGMSPDPIVAIRELTTTQEGR